jgi:hypothetical protein
MTDEHAIRNCSECREAIAADPASAPIAEHVAHCVECRAWRDELLAFDADIARALALPVPKLVLPELPELPEAGVTSLVPSQRRRLPAVAWLAAAASVAIAVALGLRLGGEDAATGNALGEQVLAHISHESFSIVVSERAVGDDRLARVLPANVARLGPDAPLVSYAQSCEINGHSVPHLVMQGAHGPVTILLMPEEKIDAPREIDDGVLSGVILPVGDGSIAIVGQDPDDIRQVEETMKNSVTWRT